MAVQCPLYQGPVNKNETVGSIGFDNDSVIQKKIYLLFKPQNVRQIALLRKS